MDNKDGMLHVHIQWESKKYITSNSSLCLDDLTSSLSQGALEGPCEGLPVCIIEPVIEE